jgi:hypothetical protein
MDFLSLPTKIPILYSIMVLRAFVGPWPHFQFLYLYAVGRTPWTGDQPVARPLPTHRTTQTQTSVPRMAFEHTILVFETLHALEWRPM